MIEVYNDCKEEKLPQPKLRLRVDGKGIYIEAVDENGEYLANLWNDKYGMSRCTKACLEEKGSFY